MCVFPSHPKRTAKHKNIYLYFGPYRVNYEVQVRTAVISLLHKGIHHNADTLGIVVERVCIVAHIGRKQDKRSGFWNDAAIGARRAFQECHFLSVERRDQIEAAIRLADLWHLRVIDPADGGTAVHMRCLIVAGAGQGDPALHMD